MLCAEAVGIKDGKLIVLGSNADVEAVTGDETTAVDLDGTFAMPGRIPSCLASTEPAASSTCCRNRACRNGSLIDHRTGYAYAG